MIRLAFRVLGLLLIAAALGAIVIDAARSIAASAVRLTALQPLWTALAPGSFAGFREFVQIRLAAAVGDWIWNPLTTSVLASPVSVELAAAGFLVLLAGARRRKSHA